MRCGNRVFLVGALTALTALWACDSQGHAASGDAPVAQPPREVACADAPQLRQRAVDDRRLVESSRSDQERILVGSRATFFTSLAILADLGCSVPLADADQPLGAALEAARQAEEERSFYVAANLWTEANFQTAQAIALLIRKRTADPEA
ncbi:MAG: hypothetical protein EA350_00300 [Gemmatimonadales bacterium]|nr:MAG: hypothetical protein EA350_00300 [Gemmatimonadales bacterium]